MEQNVHCTNHYRAMPLVPFPPTVTLPRQPAVQDDGRHIVKMREHRYRPVGPAALVPHSEVAKNPVQIAEEVQIE